MMEVVIVAQSWAVKFWGDCSNHRGSSALCLLIKLVTCFREASRCFHQKEALVEWAFLGDSRTRSLLEYFVDSYFIKSEQKEISRKAHHDFNVTYIGQNIHLSFMWAPQVELGVQ